MEYHHTLPVGYELVGEFRILEVLGSGGFANTYLALEQELGRNVAIKEFFPGALAVRKERSAVQVRTPAQEQQFRLGLDRFVREAKTLAKFRHPNIVRVFRVFEANDTAYIALEYVRGADLERWLTALGRLPTQLELDELVSPLLDALEVVHGAGILHRDVKPANIYIREVDQTPVLIDFGAARYAVGEFTGTTAAIVSKGYSPHEAYATDSRMQGPWTDIYGLAATIYRALSGSAPPESTSRILDDDFVPAVSLPAACETYRAEFLAAVDAGMALMPKARPQLIAEWRQQMFPGLAAAVSAENAPVSQPGVPSGPASAPPSFGMPRSVPGAKSDAGATATTLPPAIGRRPDLHAQPRFTGTSRLMFALGLLLLAGGIATVIETQTGLSGQLLRLASSNSVEGNSTEEARQADLQRKSEQAAEAERVRREQFAAAAAIEADRVRREQEAEEDKRRAEAEADRVRREQEAVARQKAEEDKRRAEAAAELKIEQLREKKVAVGVYPQQPPAIGDKLPKEPGPARTVKMFDLFCLSLVPEISKIEEAAAARKFTELKGKGLEEYQPQFRAEELRAWRYEDFGKEFVLTTARSKPEPQFKKEAPEFADSKNFGCSLIIPTDVPKEKVFKEMVGLLGRDPDEAWAQWPLRVHAWTGKTDKLLAVIHYYAPIMKGQNAILSASAFVKN